jgi:hypothetical protein
VIEGVSTRPADVRKADRVFAACHILRLADHFINVGAGE